MSGWFSKVDLLEAAVASQFCCQTNSIGMAAWDVNKCKAKWRGNQCSQSVCSTTRFPNTHLVCRKWLQVTRKPQLHALMRQLQGCMNSVLVNLKIMQMCELCLQYMTHVGPVISKLANKLLRFLLALLWKLPTALYCHVINGQSLSTKQNIVFGVILQANSAYFTRKLRPSILRVIFDPE